MLRQVLNENLTRQQIPTVADDIAEIKAIVTHIKERLTRFESKLHSLEGINVTPPKASPAVPKVRKLTSGSIERINKLQSIYQDGWWITEVAASQIDCNVGSVRNLIKEVDNTHGWKVERLDIPNQNRKMFRIIKEA
jgi:hypothetical protein